MHIFETNNKNTILTAILNYGEPLGLWCINFMLKTVDLNVPNIIPPLTISFTLLSKPPIHIKIFVSRILTPSPFEHVFINEGSEFHIL